MADPKKPNVLDALGAMSGLGRPELEKLWAQAQENGRKLAQCPGPHDFVAFEDRPLTSRYRCTICGGEVSASDRMWYERGLRHGRGQRG